MSRRRDESGPLSLFAFQDIITSVSGIMMLVVLLLVLEVINAKLLKRPVLATVEAAEHTAAEDLSRVEARVAKLRAELAKVEAERRKVAELKLDDAPREVASEERRRKAMTAETTTAASRLEVLTRRVEALQRELAEIERNRKESEKRVRQTQERLKDAPALRPVRYVAKRRAGERVVLVELSGKAIVVKVVGAGKPSVRFVDPKSVSFQPLLRRFETWAAARNPARDVFIVLVKPSAAGFAKELIGLLKGMRLRVGFEPLEEDRSAVGEGGAR